MRVVKIPPPVKISMPKLISDERGKRVEYEDRENTIAYFLQQAFDTCEQFSKGHVNAVLYMKLSKILSEVTQDSTEIWFEDGDFKKVEDAVRDANWLTPKINGAYLPFYEAVSGARKEDTARKSDGVKLEV